MIYWTKVHWNGLTRIMDHNGIQARCRSIEPIYILSTLGCDRRQQWRLCLEPRDAHSQLALCTRLKFTLTEAKCCTTSTLERSARSAGKASFVTTAGVVQHLIFLTRLHRRLKQQTLPGTHFPPFIEDFTYFTAFEAACQLWPTFHILVAVFGKHLWERVPLLSVDWGLRLALAKLQQLLPTRQERFN